MERGVKSAYIPLWKVRSELRFRVMGYCSSSDPYIWSGSYAISACRDRG